MFAIAVNRISGKWPKAILVLGAIFACMALSPVAMAAEPQKSADSMSKGEYLARAGDCSSCHISGPQKQAYAGGLPMNSPFGIIYATNITPDKETGIGSYTLNEFSRAIREGIAKDGHRLYPAMPYPSFSGLSDEDIKDLYNYFMHEVAPVHYAPSKTELPFPFNQRWALIFWNMFFGKSGHNRMREDRDAGWNRGAYLVRTIAHCGACHTPRGFAYEEKAYTEDSSDYLSGAMEDNWFAANLTGDNASGLGRWSEDDISAFLATGHAHGAVAFGNMSMVVENSMQFMSKSDLAAIAHYIKSMPAHGENSSYHRPVPTDLNGPTEHPGAGIYMSYCSRCHGANGEGKIPVYPALAGNSAVLSENGASLAQLTLEGGKAPQINGASAAAMPGFATKLSDDEIADVLSYIRNAWGNKAGPVIAPDVTALRKSLKK